MPEHGGPEIQLKLGHPINSGDMRPNEAEIVPTLPGI